MTETVQQNDSVSGELCNGTFCTIVKQFEVPPECDLRRKFIDWLIAHGAHNLYGRGNVVIGTKAEVISRQKCPFCRFIYARQVKPKLKLLHKDDDKLVIQVSARQEDEYLWLRVVPADGTDGDPYGFLMLPGEQLVLVTCSEDGGSRTGRVVGPTPNYEQMKWWLHLCDTHPLHHGVCTGPGIIRSEGIETLHSLRVVDVIDLRLVDIGWQEKYVAPSYVWGGSKPPKLRKNQLLVYSEKGSLEILLPTMPNTIQDLFTLTRQLGLRYLWFDSLCLIQDDPEDLRRGIMNMGLVYESSYVTIITADTDSADSGVPGVGSLYRTVKQERQVLKSGLEIMRVYSVDKHLQRSVWATRGWTLQEYYLSRRSITFVNNQAYFRCRQRNWYEELRTDLEPEIPRGQDVDVITYARDNMDLGDSNVATYTFLFKILELYQDRHLSDENDAINAMTGILRSITASANTQMIQGLPANIFPLALLFIHTGSCMPRRRKQFPSWSWAGWTKGEVSWYAFDTLGLLDGDDGEEVLENALRRTWITYRMAKFQGRLEQLWSPLTRQGGNFGSLLRSFPALQKFEVADSMPDVVTSSTNVLQQEGMRLREYPLLTFCTFAVYFRLKTPPDDRDFVDEREGVCGNQERPSFKEYDSRTYDISGQNNGDCGSLYADEKLLLEDDNVMEFVILGECFNVEFPLEFDAYCEFKSAEPTFWVVLIRLIDGSWERRGIGQILQECINDSFSPGAEWKKIVLG